MSAQAFKPTARSTLAEQVHEALLDAIKDGELRAGERLHDHMWAERWNISRTPVREAFQYLTREGLVEAAAARYTKLSDFTAESAETEAREWTMVHASLADALTSQPSDLLVTRLRRAYSRYLRATDADRPAKMFEFFSLLREATPSFGLRFGAFVSAYRFRLAMPRLPERPEADAALQAGVIAALEAADPNAFRAAFATWLTASPVPDRALLAE